MDLIVIQNLKRTPMNENIPKVGEIWKRSRANSIRVVKILNVSDQIIDYYVVWDEIKEFREEKFTRSLKEFFDLNYSIATSFDLLSINYE